MSRIVKPVMVSVVSFYTIPLYTDFNFTQTYLDVGILYERMPEMSVLIVTHATHVKRVVRSKCLRLNLFCSNTILVYDASNFTHLTHVKRVEYEAYDDMFSHCYWMLYKGNKRNNATNLWLPIHNIDTFNAMSKGSKDYVMLKQGTNTFLHQIELGLNIYTV